MDRYREWLGRRLDDEPGFLDPLRAAAGLACYCSRDVECHADILIEAMDSSGGSGGS